MDNLEYDHALRLEALDKATRTIASGRAIDEDPVNLARQFYDFLTDKQPDKPKTLRELAEASLEASQAVIDRMDNFQYGGIIAGLNRKKPEGQ